MTYLLILLLIRKLFLNKIDKDYKDGINKIDKEYQEWKVNHYINCK